MSNELQIENVLASGIRSKASDIHFKVGYRPMLRIDGNLQFLDTRVLQVPDLIGISKAILNERHQAALMENKNVDTSLQMKLAGEDHRFRVNAAFDNNGMYIVLRVIPKHILDIEKVGFPNDVWHEVVHLYRGLVLVTGVTGSGKTTTLASIIQEINRVRGDHIITIEDPIEYVHKPIRSVISQREIGVDCRNFSDGVKYSLRQDPDIILIGEIRDRETAEHALEAAATGHLVFSTLHTTDTAETVRRYINLFPVDDHTNIRHSLAANLAYIFSQQLISHEHGGHRTMAMEVMNVKDSPAIKSCILSAEFYKARGYIQIGRNLNMITMDQHLEELCKSGTISKEDALHYAYHIEELRAKL